MRFLVLFTLVTFMSTSHADDSADREARTRFRRGKALVAQNKLSEAYEEFARGYAASKRPAFLFNMGEAARGLGDIASARDAYERYLRAEPNGDYAALVARRLAELPEPTPTAIDIPPPPPQQEPIAPPPPPTVPPPAQAALAHEERMAAVPAIAEKPSSTPLWKRWPVWISVGVVLLGGAVATYAIVERSSTPPGCAMGDTMCVDLRGMP